MIDVCKAHGISEPDYRIWSDGTIVLIFQRPNTATSVEIPPKTAEFESKTAKIGGMPAFPSMSFKNIHDAIADNPTIKYEQLEKTLNISETTIRRAVKWMKENGYLDPTHSKIKGVWQIK